MSSVGCVFLLGLPGPSRQLGLWTVPRVAEFPSWRLATCCCFHSAMFLACELGKTGVCFSSLINHSLLASRTNPQSSWLPTWDFEAYSQSPVSIKAYICRKRLFHSRPRPSTFLSSSHTEHQDFSLYLGGPSVSIKVFPGQGPFNVSVLLVGQGDPTVGVGKPRLAR